LHSFLQFINAGKFGVLMVDRATEFAPIKNANDAKQDCPDTARELICGEAQQWLENAGFTVKDSAVGNIEISPLLSYNGENMDLLKKARHDPFTLPTYIDKDGNIKEMVSKIKESNSSPVKGPEPAQSAPVAAKVEIKKEEEPKPEPVPEPALAPVPVPVKVEENKPVEE